jgi:tRNA pseudouridine38-40 synthase
MPTFKLTLAYDGTDFVGWQWQPGKRSVQEELESALARVTQANTRCRASGRTDAGVHALGQVVDFESSTWLDGPTLCKALNAELPDDMLVFEVSEAPAGFHAIRHAIRKRYRYMIEDGRLRDLFERRYVWHIYHWLDVDAMKEAAAPLLGTHDFVSFQTSGSSRLTTERTIYDLTVERRQTDLTDRAVIEVEADGFLYNMVRNIVGTLVAVGQGKQLISWPAEVLRLRDRTAAGMTAPPQGLFLVEVTYPPPEKCGMQIAECGMESNEEQPID